MKSQQQEQENQGTLQDLWKRSRSTFTVVIALVFNLSTAVYTYGGMQVLEKSQPWVTLPFAIGLTVIKVWFEKEWCANLFRKRPERLLMVTAGFAFFLSAAVGFNALSITVAQSENLAASGALSARMRQWHADSGEVARVLGLLRGAVARLAQETELAYKQARAAGSNVPPEKVGEIRLQRSTIAQWQTSAAGIAPLPVTMPRDPEVATKLLTTAVASVRGVVSLLPPAQQTVVGDIRLSAPVTVTTSPVMQLGEEMARRSPIFWAIFLPALFLELFSVFTLIIGYSGLTFAERVEGMKVAVGDTARAIAEAPGQMAIPFAVCGSAIRGTLILTGAAPLSWQELDHAVQEAARESLGAPVIAMRTSEGAALTRHGDVLRQLGGRELVLEVAA